MKKIINISLISFFLEKNNKIIVFLKKAIYDIKPITPYENKKSNQSISTIDRFISASVGENGELYPAPNK